MARYSAFFASGLLAPYHRETTPVPPSSPLILPSDIDVDRSPTPTPSTAIPKTAHPKETTSNDRPRLRKRRSSLTANPLNNIKSPIRNANAALQRHTHAMSVAISPSRSRSGSVTGDVFDGAVATHANSMMGRLRSGSVGSGLRSRRALRSRPTAPPPTAPLPALPSTLGDLSSFAPSAPAAVQSFYHPNPTQKRPPLSHRLRSVDNLLTSDTMKPTTAATAPEMSPIGPESVYTLENGYRIDEEMKEN